MLRISMPYEEIGMRKKLSTLAVLSIATLAFCCTPTVQVQAPDKPIEINMNVNIKHEILVKVEREVEEMFENEELF